jgi:hypothetical protein
VILILRHYRSFRIASARTSVGESSICLDLMLTRLDESSGLSPRGASPLPWHVIAFG